MTTYALLIYRTSAPGPLSEAVERDALAGHRALQGEAAARRELHAVARLDDPATARSVRVHASGHEVSDGPFVEAKEWLVGFYLVDCEDEARALARARQICTNADHVIEVRPVSWRWRR